MKRLLASVAAVAAAVACIAAAPSAESQTLQQRNFYTKPLPQGIEKVTLHPSDFVKRIDNPYWPMTPGNSWFYRETNAHGHSQKVHVHVTDRTKRIIGLTATVVRDTVADRQGVVEDTRDWYAQDVCGNIWYLGEDTKEYGPHGQVSTEGSWQAGVHHAQPGVALPAEPKAGLSYREEYLAHVAEDAATVLSTSEQVRVPAGHFKPALLIKDYTAVEARVLEYKLYARGVGPTEEISISGGSDRAQLLRYHVK